MPSVLITVVPVSLMLVTWRCRPCRPSVARPPYMCHAEAEVAAVPERVHVERTNLGDKRGKSPSRSVRRPAVADPSRKELPADDERADLCRGQPGARTACHLVALGPPSPDESGQPPPQGAR